MQVRIYNHSFSVSGHDRNGFEFLKSFGNENFAEIDERAVRINRMPNRRGRPILPEISKVYAAATANGREFWFHRNSLDKFKLAAEAHKSLIGDIEYSYEDQYVADKVKLETLPQFKVREDQEPTVNYMLAPGTSKIVNARTGGGKTFMSLYASAQYGDRVAIIIENRFFKLWEEALSPSSDKQILKLKDNEVMWVSGSKDLSALIQLADMKQLKKVKVLVISLRTMCNYFDTYLKYGKDMLSVYPSVPIDFCKRVGIGTVLSDEFHLSTYSHFRVDLHLHMLRRFCLSATLEDGSYRDNLLGLMFPMDKRPPPGEIVKFTEVNALFYRLRSDKGIRYSVRGSKDYNHIEYEKWIMSDRGRLNNYLRMVGTWFDKRFAKVNYFKGQKAGIFAASVAMCTEITNYLTKHFKSHKIARYVATAKDDYDVSKEADCLVTTDKSFGTGMDLPGLVVALVTNSIDSPNTNIQMLGRLREIKAYGGVTPIFDYLVCEDIPKHLSYHENKKQIFRARVVSHNVRYMNVPI